MNKISITSAIALSALIFSAGVYAGDDMQAKYTEEARQTAQEFMQKLGGVLKQQLKTGGPESAINVCKQVAPAMAAEYSKNGMIVKRVSLKPRNQALGTPDKWEHHMLQSFEFDQREGAQISSLEASEIEQDADGRWFRYMKAIPTQHLCLQCHGQPYQIPDGVKALLAKEYPDDQAIGYSAGEIRGAVSIKRKID